MAKLTRIALVAAWLIVLLIAFFAAKGISRDLNNPRHPEPFGSSTSDPK